LRAVLREASTTEERIPMIAMTTRSSIRVKPFTCPRRTLEDARIIIVR
jgi:hypothetical protein